jgi:hypothetical protein
MCGLAALAARPWPSPPHIVLLRLDPVYGRGRGRWDTYATLVQVMLGCLKHQWHTSCKLSTHLDIVSRLEELISELLAEPLMAGQYSSLCLPSTTQQPPTTPTGTRVSILLPVPCATSGVEAGTAGATFSRAAGTLPSSTRSSFRIPTTPIATLPACKQKPTLIAKAYFCLAQWQQAMAGKCMDDEQTNLINGYYRSATKHAPDGWGKVWHKFGIFSMMALRLRLERRRGQEPIEDSTPLIVNAMHAFFQSVSMSSSESRHETLQVRLHARQLDSLAHMGWAKHPHNGCGRGGM